MSWIDILHILMIASFACTCGSILIAFIYGAMYSEADSPYRKTANSAMKWALIFGVNTLVFFFIFILCSK